MAPDAAAEAKLSLLLDFDPDSPPAPRCPTPTTADGRVRPGAGPLPGRLPRAARAAMPRVRVVIDPGLSAALEAALGSRVARATPSRAATSTSLLRHARLGTPALRQDPPRRGARAVPGGGAGARLASRGRRRAAAARARRLGETAEAPPFLALSGSRPPLRTPASRRRWGTRWPRSTGTGRRRSGSTTRTTSARCRRQPALRHLGGFLRERRLRPQIDRAAQAAAPRGAAARVGSPPLGARRPARSRGAARAAARRPVVRQSPSDASGAPVLVDPAASAGTERWDLAMMRLFGGFSSRVFAAYEEAFPLARARRAGRPAAALTPCSYT
jgi:hypothetical protein